MALGAVLVAATATPSFAQPTEVPDPGARPAPVGELPLPDGSWARPPAGSELLTGPLAAEIAQLELQISTLTTRLQAVEPQVEPAEAEATQAEQDWQAASQELTEAQLALDELVGDSYRGAAALPADLFIPELRGLTAHAPVPVDAPLGVRAAARRLVDARADEQAGSERYQTAQLSQQELAQERDEIDSQLAVLRPRLERLRDRNAELLVEVERAREEAAQEQDFPIREPVAGFRAGPDAVRAVQYALRQLGKPYQWGAEGPSRFDCSGLMWAAYRSVGRTLPRVANDQYWGTRLRLVAQTAGLARQGLLPGDLVFFASGPAWQSIHHVGMYIGNGYMVHAPNRNTVVQVSPVWWSRFYAATRVADAVPVDGDENLSPDPGSIPPQTPDPAPGTPPTGRPIDPDPTTPGPDPTTPGPDPTTPGPDPTDPGPEESPDPSPSDPPDPSPSDSPTPEPSPEETPTPEPEESPEPEDSPSPTPASSPTGNATASPTPTAS